VSSRVSSNGAADVLVELRELRMEISRLEKLLGRRPKLLVGELGLDGHSSGTEQLALKARDAGFDVVYEGVRVTPEQIVSSAIEEGVCLIGISMSSGSQLPLIPQLVKGARSAGIGAVPIIVVGVIPEPDAGRLRAAGVALVVAPRDLELSTTMGDFAQLVAERAQAA